MNPSKYDKTIDEAKEYENKYKISKAANDAEDRLVRAKQKYREARYRKVYGMINKLKENVRAMSAARNSTTPRKKLSPRRLRKEIRRYPVRYDPYTGYPVSYARPVRRIIKRKRKATLKPQQPTGRFNINLEGYGNSSKPMWEW